MMRSRQGSRRLAEASVSGTAGSALGFAASVGAVLAGALGGLMFGGPARVVLSGVLLAVAMVAVGAATTLAGAVAAAVQAWATYSGFVVHRLGELRWDGTDRTALVVFLVLAAGASLLARLPVTARAHPVPLPRSALVAVRSPRWGR